MKASPKFLAAVWMLALVAATRLAAAGLDWPQWRGPDRSGVSQETGLLKTWPAGGPKRVWLYSNAGNGYSAPAIVNGKLYTLGTRDGSEVLLVLDANTGQELWTAKLSAVLDDDRGDGPRGTPTVDGDRVYALTGVGTLACVSLESKKTLWQVTMRELGGAAPHWGFSESVLVDGQQVVCTPGGRKGAIAALDKMTGKLRWQSKDFTDPAHYSSIVPAPIHGEPQYVQRTERSIVGIAPGSGKLLWRADFPGRTAVAPTPIVQGNAVYVTAGYGAGCKLVRIEPGNKVREVYENKVMKNHHGGVVLVGDFLYGYSDATGWICQEFATGRQMWANEGIRKGAIAAADGMLYCVDERGGTVALVEATPKSWTPRGRFTLQPLSKIRASSGGIWPHPVISNGKLYLRDQDLIYCYDVSAAGT